ncbi:DNA damage-binding protein 2 isoform X1 [Sorex fumeus]|uniref:DNA damage-binding protein 2 isoform X1 n=1 Tax=Sorex fumeus TaxID=62283 RepID=UPI0024AD2EF7|nr:DNA damage-binding protein 2 isoform X1 [Sorex fumeus]
MAPRKRPEKQKTLEVAVRPASKRSRSPREPEPEAKQRRLKSPGSSGKFDSGCLWAGLASLQVPPLPSNSIIKALQHRKLGQAVQQALQQSFLHSLASYEIFQRAAPFDRRATALAWHPAHPNILAVGSKGGDIFLWNVRLKNKPTFLKGIGAGGSITGMKFNPLNHNQLFTSSMEGTTRLQDFKGNTIRVFTSSSSCNVWFCSLDVSARSHVVVTGDNMGNVSLLTTDGKELWNLKMHKKKVSHVALNPCCDWVLATASVDQTVKIWDLRQVKGKSSFLCSLPHCQGVNSAAFSPDGARLLTTDQKSELRVYSASRWDCPPNLIPHPHRRFQHLTPIKATWHPRHDLIIVGRYPDPHFTSCAPSELRTIDVFDGSSGKMLYQFSDPGSLGIISLNEFNPMGDTLASLMGYNILVWSQKEVGTQE